MKLLLALLLGATAGSENPWAPVGPAPPRTIGPAGLTVAYQPPPMKDEDKAKLASALQTALNARLAQNTHGKALLDYFKNANSDLPPVGFDSDASAPIGAFSFKQDKVLFNQGTVESALAAQTGDPAAKAKELARKLAVVYFHELWHRRQKRELGLGKRDKVPVEIEEQAILEESAFLQEEVAKDHAFYAAHLSDPIIGHNLDKYVNAVFRSADQVRKDTRDHYLKQDQYATLDDLDKTAKNEDQRKDVAAQRSAFKAYFDQAGADWSKASAERLDQVIGLYAGGDAAQRQWLLDTAKKALPADKYADFEKRFQAAAKSADQKPGKGTAFQQAESLKSSQEAAARSGTPEGAAGAGAGGYDGKKTQTETPPSSQPSLRDSNTSNAPAAHPSWASDDVPPPRIVADPKPPHVNIVGIGLGAMGAGALGLIMLGPIGLVLGMALGGWMGNNLPQ